MKRPADQLLRWFDGNKRMLPWRQSRDPYRIWVSEIMLQQTQVERVIPYFESFVTRFPRLESLAAASLDDVLAAWSGLGYYRRARHLHAAARQIVARGEFPREIGDWVALPGVGQYTAAAITSIAFDAKVPVLDANVERVLSRLEALGEDPKKASGRRRLIAIAGSLLDDERPGDSNQALMELGATVCTPRSPGCPRCPLNPRCVALELGKQEDFPVKRASRETRTEHRIAVVVEENGKLLLFRRPQTSPVLGGFWEFPWTSERGRRQAAIDLSDRYGGRWHLDRRSGQVRHSITFRYLRIDVWRGEMLPGDRLRERPLEASWFRREALEEIPLSTLVTKVLKCSDES